MAGPSLLYMEDQPALSLMPLESIPVFDPGIIIFDPDHAISTTRLASATSATIQQLCQQIGRAHV